IAIQVARSLAALHSGGRLHLAVSPAAVLYDPHTDDAHLLEADCAAAAGATPAQGCFEYISPEQTGRTGRPPDHRSDLYSLGATLFHLLCGRPPFTANDALEMVH